MMFDGAAVAAFQAAAVDASDHTPAPAFDNHDDAPAIAKVPVEAHSAHPATTDPVDPTRPATEDPVRDRLPVEPRDIAETDIATDAAPTSPTHDIIFIDTAVADYRDLAAQWADKGQVVLIDGTKDGIDQVRAALVGQSDVGAIHIVSHGAEGVLWLGTTKIDEAAINGDLAGSLGAIGRSLTPGGDILLYGCDFAEGTDGASALAAFARATHADVAASTDVTGYAARGGDWNLEAHDGSIEARSLDAYDWVHTLAPNNPVPISVTADSLTVRDGNGNIVTTGTTGYGSDSRSPDVGAGAVATWSNVATFNGQNVDLRAVVVSISTGDAIRFNRPTGTGLNGDDPTFLLRDLTAQNDATVQIRWELVISGTNTALPADVRFTIADIDGIGGNPNSRESVTASTTGLAYYTRERVSDINFTASLNAITASGTQNENTVANQPLSPQSAATFDWSAVSSFTLTYKLTTNAVTTQAQFYHDGDADFVYNDPVYVSVPRLDLDANDSTASGNDAHFTFTENGAAVPIVDADLVVTNPMGPSSITGATVRLTNYHNGDTFSIGTLPSNISASIGAVTGGAVTITLTGNGSEADYTAALKAISFSNTTDTPDPAQRVIDITFSNDTLTSAVATSRIDVIPVNDVPVAVNDTANTVEDTPVTIAVLNNDSDLDGDALTVTAATALHGSVVRNPDGTLTYTPNANYHGTDTISYTIDDGHGGTASATVAVTIQSQQDTPVNTVPGAQTVGEDGTLIFSSANGNAISIADVDGGEQTVTLTATHGTLTLGGIAGLTFTAGDGTGDATMTFTGSIAAINAALNGTAFAPAADYNGPAQISLDVTTVPVTGEDFTNGGMEAPGIPAGSNAFVIDTDVPGWRTTATDHKIEIWGNGYQGVPSYQGNQYFEINATQAATLYQDFRSVAGSAVSVDFAHRGRMGADTMQVTAIDLGADGVFGTGDDVVLSQQQYTDGNTAWGAYTQQVTGSASGNLIRIELSSISTSTGNQSIGNFIDGVALHQASVPMSAHSDIAINVTPVADIADDSTTTPEDTAVTIAPLDNDSFEDPTASIVAIDGQAISVGGPAVNVANGTVQLDASQHLIFTPGTNYHGTTTFTYTVSSSGVTETATETVVVTPVNDAPTPVGMLPARNTSDAATVSYATSGGFTDVDGDTLTYSATGLPAGLSIDSATGVISGTIDRSASQIGGGVYSVVVTARDPSNASTTQSFAITVANPAPTATNDSATVAEDASVVIPVLGNDSDPDGDPLIVTTASALHGTVTINPDNTLTYAPNADYNGSDTISYTISDGQGGTASATVAVTITPMNDAPAPNGTLDPVVTRDGKAISVPTASGFGDVDGDTLTYTVTGLPAGLAINAATGVISGSIDRSASQIGGGIYTVVVTARDPSNATATQGFTITVTNPGPTAIDDTASTHTDTPVTVAVLANDGDPDGDPLTVTTASAAQGTVTINPDGTLRYVPPAGFEGTDTIHYTISDGEGGTASATLTIMVGNTAPVAQPLDPVATNDSAAISLPLAGKFSDADGDTLTYSATGLPPGLSIDPATGVVSGTITHDASQTNGGGYDAIITVIDGHGGSTSATLHFDVVNPAPIANDDSATTAEDTPVTITVLTNDSDPDGDSLTVTAATALHGTVTINPDGTLNYAPNANYNGPDTITYTITDSDGATATAHVDVTVTPVNDPPATTGLPPLTNPDATGVSVPTAGSFSDVDGDTLTYTATGLPPGLSIDPATGIVSGTITPGSVYGGPGGDGIYHVVVTATDPSGGHVDAPFDWTVTQVPPDAVDDHVTTPEDTPIAIRPLLNDTDGDNDTLTITGATADTGSVAINGNKIVFTPAANFNGTATITYTISDGHGGTDTATITVDVTPVNDAPTSDALPPEHAKDGRGVSLDLGGYFHDVDGDALAFSASGLPAGLSISAAGVITGTIDRSASQIAGGVYHVTVTATDPSGATTSSSFDWTIVNPAPVAVDDSATLAEDTSVTITVLANDSDPDGDPLTVTGATAGHGVVTVNPDGTLTYTANADFNGNDVIVYTISDGEGGTASASVLVTVTPVNDPPVAVNDVGTTPEDTPVDVTVLGNDSDVDGDLLTVISASANNGTVTINPDGTIHYVPNADFNGVDKINYTISDGHGGTSSAFARITVTPVNDAPVANPDTATTPEDTPVVIAVLPNDSDVDGDALTVTAASALHGSVTINPDGTLTYTPNADYNGVDTINYTIDDGHGGTASSTVAVTVTPVNDAPVAVNDIATTSEDTPVDVVVLTNDSDVDGDSLTVISASANNGTVTINTDGSIHYVPNPDFNGVDKISYTISDGHGGTASAFARVTVTPVNDPPVAVNDVATTAEDTPVDVVVLTNDSDIDGDTLTVISASANNGTVTINPDGTIHYVPNVDFNGVDKINYTISDGHGGTSSAFARITVTPVNDAPVAVNDTATTAEDTPVTITVLPNDRDVDGDPLTVTAATAQHGTVAINPDGTLTYVPNPDFNGTDDVTYTISDGNGGTATAIARVTVTPVNDPPVANPDSVITPEDVPVTIPVLPNDTDVDGDPLTVTTATAQHGTVTINPDGTITYTPTANYNGGDTIAYTISDGRGGTASSSVTVTVSPVNDAPTPVDTLPVVGTQDGLTLNLPTAPGFTDVDGDTLTYTATGLPAGLSIDPATGVISGTIDRSASQTNGGTYNVVITATDPSNASATQTLTIHVTNPAPVAVDDTARTNEDTGITIPVLSNDSDPDGDPLTVTAATAAHGAVTINPDGTVTYVPGPNFAGTDTIRYTISDGQGGTATAIVTVTVDPVNDAPVIASRDPVDATGGYPVRIDPLTGVTDPDGDPVTLTSATSANGNVVINPDGTITFTPVLGFVGTTTITYTVSDGQGGVTTGTIVVRVADGRAADLNALLRIGQVSFRDPTPHVATINLTDGTARNPLSLLDTAESIRSLRTTAIGDQPIRDAVAAIGSLNSTDIDPDAPVTAEVARIDGLRDLRDAGDRLFDQRWGDFMVKGLSGFSCAADRNACVMIESVVRGGAIYLEVRDIADEGARAPIRSVDVRLAGGGKVPDWIRIDPRGLVIIERGADMDELHLVVRVTRTDGRTSSTPILVQGSTGEVELDRQYTAKRSAARLDDTLTTPAAAAKADADRLSNTFE